MEECQEGLFLQVWFDGRGHGDLAFTNGLQQEVVRVDVVPVEEFEKPVDQSELLFLALA